MDNETNMQLHAMSVLSNVYFVAATIIYSMRQSWRTAVRDVHAIMGFVKSPRTGSRCTIGAAVVVGVQRAFIVYADRYRISVRETYWTCNCCLNHETSSSTWSNQHWSGQSHC